MGGTHSRDLFQNGSTKVCIVIPYGYSKEISGSFCPGPTDISHLSVQVSLHDTELCSVDILICGPFHFSESSQLKQTTKPKGWEKVRVFSPSPGWKKLRHKGFKVLPVLALHWSWAKPRRSISPRQDQVLYIKFLYSRPGTPPRFFDSEPKSSFLLSVVSQCSEATNARQVPLVITCG